MAEGGLEARLRKVEELATRTAQLTVVHDTQIRELATFMRTVQIKREHPWFAKLGEVDSAWRDSRARFLKDRDGAKVRGEDGPTSIGSKHLLLAATAIELFSSDAKTAGEVKSNLATRWQGQDTSNSRFLESDVKLFKWRVVRDSSSGILEFKLAEELQAMEAEMVRVIVAWGGIVKQGTAPRGPRVRDLEERLQRTWDRTGSGTRQG